MLSSVQALGRGEEHPCPELSAQINRSSFSARAMRLDIQRGEPLLAFSIQPNGELQNLVVMRSTDERLSAALLAAVSVRKIQCPARDTAIRARVPVLFVLQD